MAAAAAGEWTAAETHFERALDLADTLPHRVDQARTAPRPGARLPPRPASSARLPVTVRAAWPTDVEAALAQAGENRAAFEHVSKHYQELLTDRKI